MKFRRRPRLMGSGVLLAAALSAVAAAGEGPGRLAAPALPVLFSSLPGAAGREVLWALAPGYSAVFRTRGPVLRAAGVDLAISFQATERQVRIRPVGRAPGVVNLLRGASPRAWAAHRSTYDAVEYENLYAGVTLRYQNDRGRLKSEFLVAAGADAGRIRWRFGGGAKAQLAADGSLEVCAQKGCWKEEKPLAWQDRPEGRKPVGAAYKLDAAGGAAFELGPYDRSLPLLIDPTLTYSTLVGAYGSSSALAVDVDGAGMVYVAGYSDAAQFPVTPGTLARGGSVDAFVYKINPVAGTLVWATWLGGSGDDRAYGVAVDAGAAVYVTGSTTSANFPRVSAQQTSRRGSRDAFVCKLNSTGTALVWSTYLGGGGADTARAIDVDGAGNTVVAGETDALDFPVLNAYRAANGGATDAFITQFNPGGTISASTYLGGNAADRARAVRFTSGGGVAVAGSTESPNLPVASAYQGTLRGPQDAFLARFPASWTTPLFVTYFGGSGGGVAAPEEALSLALEASDALVVAGISASSDLPLQNPLFTYSGDRDAWVARFSSSGASLLFSTYLGGAAADQANAVAVDASGQIYVAGQTYSSSFPVVYAAQPAHAGSYDGFFTIIDPLTPVLVFSTFLGGSGSDGVLAMVAANGTATLAGLSASVNFPLVRGLGTAAGGWNNSFVAQYSSGAATPELLSVTPAGASGAGTTFQASYRYTPGAALLTEVSLLVQSLASTANACLVRHVPGSGQLQLASNDGSVWSTVRPGTADTAENTQCRLRGPGSAATVSGAELSLAADLTFFASFNGARNLYLRAAAGAQVADYTALGAYTVSAAAANQTPQAVSVAPVSGSGTTTTFTFVFTDGDGVADLSTVYGLVGLSASLAQGCAVRYVSAGSQLALGSDAGTSWTVVRPGTSDSGVNSQCVLNGAGSSVSTAGANLTVQVNLTFRPPFGGPKTTYGRALDQSAADSGWTQRGVFTVLAAPATGSVSPSSGSGGAAVFTATFSDTNGSADLYFAQLLVNTTPAGAGACFLSHLQGGGKISLASDDMSYWTPVRVGTTDMAENSRCMLAGINSAVVEAGNTLTLTAALTFRPAANGNQNVYLRAIDRTIMDTGFVAAGTYSVALVQPPAVGTLAPASGSGGSATFTATYSDPNGAADLFFTQLLINQTPSGSGGCFVSHMQGSGKIWLAADDMSSWTSLRLGTSETVQNSRCILSASGSSVSEAGTTLTLNAALAFKAAAQGPANLYLRAIDRNTQETGFVQKGSYTVVVAAAPQTGALTPAVSTGMGTLFTASFSDANGSSDLLFVQVLVNTAAVGTQGCFVSHMPDQGTLRLASDDMSAWGTVRPGTSDLAENSRCKLSGQNSALLAANGSYRMVLNLRFKSAAAGDWKIYARAIDRSILETGFVEKGSYTISTATSAAIGAITPNAGAGLHSTFSLVATHPADGALIDRVKLRVGDSPGGPGACVAEYRRLVNEFYLANSDESVWTLVRPGTADTTNNPQCRLYGSASSATLAGTILTMNSRLGFYPAWGGTRNLYAEVVTTGGISSGWVWVGTYTVAGDGSAPPDP